MTRPLSTTIVIPTFHRPDALIRCLDGIAAQERSPDAVVVVVRSDDTETIAALSERAQTPPRFRVVESPQPGQVAALTAGLATVESDIVAFIDDDAVPRPDWLRRVLDHFESDPHLGGVGGKDEVDPVPSGGWGERATVGVITWYGKVVGEHHRGIGLSRSVQILKGANMVYRREALGDRKPGEGLGGGGAEPDNDLELSLSVWAAGWTLIYDPQAVVDHFVIGKETSRTLSARAPNDSWQAAYNRTLALQRHLPRFHRLSTIVYGAAVGTPLAPGILQAMRLRRRGVKRVVAHLLAALRGALAGFRSSRSEQVAATSPPPDTRRRMTLVAHDVGGIGGMERALGQLVEHGSDRVRFTVVSSTLEPDLRHLVDWRRVPVPGTPFAFKFIFFWVIGSFRAWRTGQPLHTYGAIVGNHAAVSTVQFCHQGYVEATGSLTPKTARPVRRAHHLLVRVLSIWAEKWCFRAKITRRFVAVSERVAGELERHYPGPPISLAHNGVDVDEFHPDSEIRQHMRTDLGLPEIRTVVLFVGGDWDRKGLPVLLEAFVEAEPINRDLELWVVGDGDGAHLISGLPADIADRVRCFGVQREVAPYYQAADIFSLPSEYETFAIVAFEAAATALPVIVSDTGALQELPEAGGGFLVPIEVPPIREALETLIDDPALRQSMGAHAREAAHQRTWTRHVDSTIDAYRETLDVADSRLSEES